MSRTLESSPNALINKKVLDRYLTLELPENKILASTFGSMEPMNTFDAKIEPLILYRNRQKVSEIDKHQLRSANEVALFCILQTIYVILDINAIKSSALEIDFNCVHAVYQRQTAIIQIVSIICCVQNQP